MAYGVSQYEIFFFFHSIPFRAVLQLLARPSTNDGQEENKSDVPMNQYAFSFVEALLDEDIAGGEMLEDVVVSDIVDLDDMVLEVGEEMVIERQPQHGDYMCDVGLGQGVFAP